MAEEGLKKTANDRIFIGNPLPVDADKLKSELSYLERQAWNECSDILAGITTKELLNATDMAIEMKQKGVFGKPCPDYVDETVSMKVVRIIQGYVNVVNKMVWRKEQ